MYFPLSSLQGSQANKYFFGGAEGEWSTSRVALMVNNLSANAGDMRLRFDPGVRKIPWSRKWQPAPVFWPGEFHGQRSLADDSPQGCTELYTTEHMSTHEELTKGRARAN